MKITSLLAALCLGGAAAAVPAGAHALSLVEIDGYVYDIDVANREGQATVCGVVDTTLTQAVVPQSIVSGGTVYEVTSLRKAFVDCPNLVKVTLPPTINHLGDSAFAGCVSLTDIKLPEAVADIEWSAFAGCVSRESVDLPAGLRRLSERAFYGCRSLRSIVLPDGLNKISASTFAGCVRLDSVHIPASVDSIAMWAFAGCESLPKVWLPDRTRAVKTHAFSGCTSLSRVRLSPAIRRIESAAFADCPSLDSIALPNELDYIGKGAFARCVSLAKLEMPDSLAEIDDDAFDGCVRLTDPTFWHGENAPDPETHGRLRRIGDNAFRNCHTFTGIRLPETTLSVGEEAFKGCKALAQVHLSDSLMTIARETFSGCILLAGVNMPDSLRAIGDKSFYDCVALASLQLPDSLTAIGKEAFHHCKTLAAVAFNDTLQTLGHGAFSECVALTSISIPASLTALPATAFAGCTSLRSVELPAALTEIGRMAFAGCMALERVSLPVKLKSLGEYSFRGCSSLSAVSFGDVITAIPRGAFLDCASLRSITLPEQTASVGDEAFAGCPVPTHFALPAGLATISGSPFGSCDNLRNVTVLSATPAPLTAHPFGGGRYNSADIGVWVPAGSGRDYSEAPYWKDYTIHEGRYTSAGALAVTPAAATVRIGTTITLEAEVNPAAATEKTVEWTSADPDIATVDPVSGVVAPVSRGSVAITARTPEGVAGSMSLTVDYAASEAISFLLEELPPRIEKGTRFKIRAQVAPETADQNVVFASADPSVLTVESDGMSVAAAPGETEITATTSDGLTARAAVKVDSTLARVVYLKKYVSMAKKGQSFRFVAAVDPDNTTDKTIVWSSSADTVATVDPEGLVTFVHGGSTVIRATCGAASAGCRVNVEEDPEALRLDLDTMEINVSSSYLLVAIPQPASARHYRVAWSSADPTIASVDSYGRVYGHTEGETTVTASVANNAEIAASCIVRVVPADVTSISSPGADSPGISVTDGRISLSGINPSTPVALYSASGARLFSGAASAMGMRLQPGVYILVVDGKPHKLRL